MKKKKIEIQEKILKLLKESRENLYENMDLSFKLAEEAFELSNENEFELGYAIALLRLGSIYRIRGEFEKAVKYSFDAKERIEDLNIKIHLVDVLNNIGNIFADNSDFDTALSYYMKATRILNELKEDESVKYFRYVVNNNIGEIYNELHSYDTAIEYFEKSIDYIKNSSKKSHIVVPYINLGEVYQKINSFDKALLYLNKALDVLRQNKLDFFEPDVYFCIAKIYAGKQMIDEAYKNYKISIKIVEEKNVIYFQVNILLSFYEFLLKIDKIDEAFEILEKTYKISIENNYKMKLSEIYSNYAKYYEKRENYHQALNYYKNYHDEDRSKQNSETEKIVKHLKNQIKINKIEHEKEVIHLKNKKLTEKTKEVEKLYRDISLISEMGREITSVLDLDKVVNKTHKYFMRIVPFDEFSLRIYDESGERLEFSFFAQSDQGNKKTEHKNENNLFEKYITKKNTEVFYNEIDHLVVYIPLIIEERVIGGVYLNRQTSKSYTDEAVTIIKAFVSYVSIAVNNAQKSMKLKEANKKLLSLSLKDSMTEIANRRRFEEVYKREWWRAVRYKTPMSLIMFDIDKFKQFNDNYGHLEGDECIKRIARAADVFFKRAIDLVARYGGDEFVVILPDTNLESTIELAEKLRDHIENELKYKHEFSSISKYVTITLGVASTYPSSNFDEKNLLDKADEALYKAKEAGRNRVEYFEI